MFRKRNILIAIFMMALVAVSSGAVVAVLVALGAINLDLPAPQLNFVRNVGYSVFAGGIIIALVELPRIIRDLIRAGGA